MNRAFDCDRPNQLLTTDLTSLPTREDRLDCCAALDVFFRRVVGRSLDRRATTAMVNTAHSMAITERATTRDSLLDIDHGPHYTSWRSLRRSAPPDSSSQSEPSATPTTTLSSSYSRQLCRSSFSAASTGTLQSSTESRPTTITLLPISMSTTSGGSSSARLV